MTGRSGSRVRNGAATTPPAAGRLRAGPGWGRGITGKKSGAAVLGAVFAVTSSFALAGGTASAAGSKSPIVVGGVIAKSDFTGSDTGFAARIARLNRQGGIDGHPIKFVGASDDGESASTDLTQTQNLILNDHVVAIAPVVTSGFLSASAAFATKHKTPFLGWGFLPAFCGSKWAYGFNGCLVGSAVLNTSIAQPAMNFVNKTPSKVRVAILSNSTTVGAANKALYSTLVSALGGKVVYDEDTMPISGVTDYSPYVSAVLATHPNLIVQGMSFSQVAAFVGALRAAGYTGGSLDYQTYVPGLLAAQPALASALSGELISAQIPPQEGGTPAVKQLSKDLVAIKAPPAISLGESVGYWTADVLIQMLQATAKAGRPLTGAGIEATVNSGFHYKGTIAGGIGPVNFPQNETTPVPCSVLLQVTGTNYKVVSPFNCYKTIKAK